MSDDLIRRSDAIKAITNHCENECYYRVDNWCPQCQREEFEEAIKAVPSADRPSGEWRATTEKFYSDWRCSQCGASALLDNVEQMCLSNFCPNCGAKMKGADDEDN